MAEKVLRLHPSCVFFLSGGLHLVNPEKPFVHLPENYQAPDVVLTAIKNKTLIDVNGNILVEKTKKEKPAVEAPTVDESLSDEETVEVKEEEKAEKQKKKAPAKK